MKNSADSRHTIFSANFSYEDVVGLQAQLCIGQTAQVQSSSGHST